MVSEVELTNCDLTNYVNSWDQLRYSRSEIHIRPSSCNSSLVLTISQLTTPKHAANADALFLKNPSHNSRTVSIICGGACGTIGASLFFEHCSMSRLQDFAHSCKVSGFCFFDVIMSSLGSLFIVPNNPAVFPKYQPIENQVINNKFIYNMVNVPNFLAIPVSFTMQISYCKLHSIV